MPSIINQTIIVTTIVNIFAAIALGILSSFQLGAASLTNQSNNTTTVASLPIADIPFYIEHITVTGQNSIIATHVEVSLSGNGT